jgi:hypothetical protein
MPGWRSPLLLVLGVAAATLQVPAATAAVGCTYVGGNLGSWHQPGNWDCGQVPTSVDQVVIPPLKDVVVGAAATAQQVSLAGANSKLTFANEATLSVQELFVSAGTLQGAGTLTVSGAFTKGGTAQTDTMFVLDTVDLVLNGDSSFAEGTMSICQAGDPPSDPTVHINADFTIEPTASSPAPFNCSSSGARIRVGPSGHLIQANPAARTSFTAIDNDGLITAAAGDLMLHGGTADSLGATSDGDYIADADATLGIEFGASPPLLGATGRYGGAGTIHIGALGVTAKPGATIDPAHLKVSGNLRLEGATTTTWPSLELANGSIRSDRPVEVGEMTATGGSLARDFTMTVTDSFAMTGPGTLSVTNEGALGSPDLVLDGDATLTGGRLCVARNGDHDPDHPQLHINQDFVVGAAAPSDALGCGPQFGTLRHVNGPDGHLRKDGPGSLALNDIEVAGGTLEVGAGQTFSVVNTFSQTAGVTDVAADGVLAAGPTLSGGVLRGAGQVTGSVTNTAGTVRPGAAVGTLTVTGAYTQGAAGVLDVDVAGTAPGTGHDVLVVGGAATLDGTVSVVRGAGFDPAVADTFTVLTSASRTGAFDGLVGSRLPSGKGYIVEHPGSSGARLAVTATPGTVISPTLTGTSPDSPAADRTPDVTGTAPAGSTIAVYPTPDCSGPPAAVGSAAAFAAPGLTVSVAADSSTTFRATASLGNDTSPCSATSVEYVAETPVDVVVDETTSQPFLDGLVRVSGNLVMDGIGARTNLVADSLVEVGQDVIVTGNGELELVSLNELGAVGGSVEISGNVAAGDVDLGNVEAAGDVTITDNGQATVNIALNGAGGDVTIESEGSGLLDLGTGHASGDLDLSTAGHPEVSGATPAGSIMLESQQPQASMTVDIPDGGFAQGVPFTVTHLDPAGLPPVAGTGPGGGSATVDPVAAWQLAFGVPTLGQDATLSFDILVDSLDSATRSALLSALASGRATLATSGDAAGSTFQAFPLCSGGAAPTDGGCVSVAILDANGQPTTSTPSIVRFTGVTGHFSTWAVAIVTPTTAAPPPLQPAPQPVPPSPGLPSNAFSLGTLKLNKRLGNAKLAVVVPGRGQVSLTGKNLRRRSAAPTAAGTVRLKIAAKGKARTQLEATGRTTLRVVVTYTPTGGNAASKTKRVRLKLTIG